MKYGLIIAALASGIIGAPALASGIIGAPALAQTVPDMPTTAAPAAASVTGYKLASEDVLSINVVNYTNLSVPQVMITPDGTISLPLLDPIQASGKTTMELTQILTKKWRRYVINPSVSVALVQKHRETVILSGFVAHPGPADYRPDMHVLNALANAGDALPNGDLEHVVVTHADRTKQTLDLSHPETKGGTAADLLVEPGDVVYVPEARAEFSVIGEVNKPGSYEYKSDMTVLDALTAVGGVKDTADLSSAKLTHNGQDTKIDLDALIRHGDMSQNVKLSAGDRLLLPEGNRTYVYGAVYRPGYYTFTPGDRVLDALNSAGGPMQQNNVSSPDLSKINLIRIASTKNSAAVQQVNLEQFLKKGDMSGNVQLQPGDVLYIPDKKRGFQFSDLYGALSGLNLINLGAHIFTTGLGR